MSETDFCGDLYKIIANSNVLKDCFVNNIYQRIMCKNVDNTAHDALDMLINSYGVFYGTRVLLSFCDCVCNVPQLDFAAFLPIDRSNAPKNAEDYCKIVDSCLSRYNCKGVVVTMAVERSAHSIEYYSVLSAKDYFDCLYRWSTNCAAEFLLADDDMPFYSVTTPSIRQIAAYSFGSEADGVVTANERTLGDVCVSLAESILCKMPVDGDIVGAMSTKINNKELCAEKHRRLCSIFEAIKRYNAVFDVYI